MLDHIRGKLGLSVGELAQKFDVSRIAVMKHLAVLEKANLVTSEKNGRTRQPYLNAMPIQDIHERWTDTYSSHWADRVNIIKHAAKAVARKAIRNDDDL